VLIDITAGVEADTTAEALQDMHADGAELVQNPPFCAGRWPDSNQGWAGSVPGILRAAC